MAVLPGALIEGGTGGANARITFDLDEYLLADIWPPSVSAATAYAGGTPADNTPVEQPGGSVPGAQLHTYLLDYYYRVHIVPSRIEFGAVVARAVRDVEVWSAHFVSNELTSIDESNTDGLTLHAPVDPPTTFLPLDSRAYVLEADVTGPALIDALYTFNFALDTSTLSIVGDRVVPWPFPPNWSRPVLERLEWKTSVLAAHDGKEQRAQIRDGARLVYEYEMLEGGDRERVMLENLLHSWQAQIFGLPFWHQQERLAADLPAASLAIPTATDTSDYIVGGLVALVDGLTVELIEIAAVGPGVVTLSTATAELFPKGSKAMPARLARLPISMDLSYPSDAIVGALIRFEGVLDESYTPAVESADYRSYPVLLERRDWAQDVSATYPRIAVRVDYGTGLAVVDDHAEFSPVSRGHGWVLGGRQAIADFRSFLETRSGRIAPIWIPTGHRDFDLQSTIGSTDTAMTVENREHARSPLQLGRRDFLLELVDGSRFYRRVTATTRLSAAQESVAFDSAIGQNVEPAEVRRISYLGLSRLAADSVELAHDTDAITRVQTAFRLIRDDVP